MVMLNPSSPTPQDGTGVSCGPTLTPMLSTLHPGSAMAAIAFPQFDQRADQRRSQDPSRNRMSIESQAPRLDQTHTPTRTQSPGPDQAAKLRSQARPARVPTGRAAPTSQGFVVAVMAAHNAEARISRTLHALDAQTRPVDSVIVVTDNCTDYTSVMALAAGATIVDAAGNSEGLYGALNLALAEVVEMLDDSDLVVILDDDVCLEPDFIARASRRLWTPPAKRPVAAVRPDVGSSHAGVYSVESLRRVMADRKHLVLPDRSGTAGVFDTRAVSPDAELAVALEATGHIVVESGGRPGAAAPVLSGRTLFNAHRQLQHGLLDALSAHGVKRPLLRTLVGEIHSLVAIALIPAVLTTVAISAAHGQLPGWSLALWSGALGAWIARRGWSVRVDGWRAVARTLSVVPELVRSTVVAAGRFVGSAHWLHGVPSLWGRRSPRQPDWVPEWVHGESGHTPMFDPSPMSASTRRRSDRKAESPPTSRLTLVRVPGPAVVIERVPTEPTEQPGRWRNHAAVALGFTMIATVTVGIPLASLSLAWGILTVAATVSIVANVTAMVTSSVD